MDEVTLKLTMEEAKALKVITELIAGSPLYTRRRHTDAISLKLRMAGIAIATCRADDVGGVITFHPETP